LPSLRPVVIRTTTKDDLDDYRSFIHMISTDTDFEAAKQHYHEREARRRT